MKAQIRSWHCQCNETPFFLHQRTVLRAEAAEQGIAVLEEKLYKDGNRPSSKGQPEEAFSNQFWRDFQAEEREEGSGGRRDQFGRGGRSWSAG